MTQCWHLCSECEGDPLRGRHGDIPPHVGAAQHLQGQVSWGRREWWLGNKYKQITSLRRKSPFVPGSPIQYISSRSLLCNLKNTEEQCTTLNQFQSNMDCFEYIYSTRCGKLWIHSMKITLIFVSFFRTQSRFRPTRWRARIFNDIQMKKHWYFFSEKAWRKKDFLKKFCITKTGCDFP